MSRISIIIPIFNEIENLPLLCERLAKVFAQLPDEPEFLFVDDGSSDGSAEWLAKKTASEPRIRLLRLSRNFGHQAAITAGLDYADGDAAVIMDADLQDPPELIPVMLEKWRQGCDVVSAVRRSRAGEKWHKRLFARLFYRLFRAITKVDAPVEAGDFKLLDKKVVLALRRLRESHRYLRAMTSWVGFTHEFVEYDRAPRHAGRTKYPAWKSLRLALDGLTSFSASPLRWVSGLGALVSVLGVIWLANILLSKWLNPKSLVPGWTSVIAALLIFSGIQLISIGLLGQYVSRIFEETKKRPLYILRDSPEPVKERKP